MDIQQIMSVLPHRYPFLLVDRIVELDASVSGVGIKCVTANEPHLVGHFPGLPIMPGVLILEHQAQVGGAVLLAGDRYRHHLALLAGVEKARFKRRVVPGDVLRTEVKLLRAKASVVWMECRTTVDDELVCESVMLCAMQAPADKESR